MKIKEIFLLAADALRERKARSALTIVMVVVGSSLMVALNGISAGQNNFIHHQLNTLAPNILFVSSGQRSFRGGGGGPAPLASITINSAVVTRITSLPFVQQVVPSYQGQGSLESQGNFVKFTDICNGSTEGLPNYSKSSTHGWVCNKIKCSSLEILYKSSEARNILDVYRLASTTCY